MKKPFSAENITTLISRSSEITGDIHFSGILEIEGKVYGNIYADEDSKAEVRIRESGLVKGEIKVPIVIINGLVEGDIYSNNHVELAAKAKIVGNVYYHLIEMVMGSEVNGSLCQQTPEQLSTRHLSAGPSEGVSGGQNVKSEDQVILD